MTEKPVVLDASAILAWLQGEPGTEEVERSLARARVSTVNWSEVVQKAMAHQVEINGLREELEALGVVFEPFGADDAESAARLWSKTKPLGLSLADRACLSLALRCKGVALTADSAWARLRLPGVTVRLVR